MRLHVGCGENYLENFVNIELPQNRHLKADVYANIFDLDYKEKSIEEIYLSHVFEHFDRIESLLLLGKFNFWLKNNGILNIITPDFEENIKSFLSGLLSYEEKQKILRHIFGTHEADWAVHRDGWYYEKFKHILNKFGFRVNFASKLIVESDPIRYDIQVISNKVEDVSYDQIIESSNKILKESLFDSNEDIIYKSWMDRIQPREEVKIKVPDRSKMVLIFSKDRAMQLDCTLNTLYKYCKDINSTDVCVLYTCSNSDFEVQYARLYDFYPNVKFYKETSFKNNVLFLMSGYQYCMLCVDDCVFTNDFLLEDSIDILEYMPTVIGFSLRLGKNIDYCYMLDTKQSIPDYKHCGKGIIFDWVKGEYDFGYPLEVSSSVYRTDDLIGIIAGSQFENPNVLELVLDRNKSLLNEKNLLACYQNSVAFCNPINKVQNQINNRSGNVSIEDLFNKFYIGQRIRTDKFHNLMVSSPHEEVELSFDNKNLVDEDPLISIIIPSFNGYKCLHECLSSICRNTDSKYEIIVIDNCKDDETLNIIKCISRKIKVIKNEKNLGASAARNQGIKLATGKYLAFMDDDLIVTRHWDRKFLEYMDKVPKVGIIGPRSNHVSGIQYVDGCKYTNLFELEQYSQNFGKHEKGLIPIIRLVSFCYFVRREVIEKIGGFDESFNIFFEDDDFTLRCVIAGFNPAVAKNIFIHHSGGPLKDGDQEYLDKMKASWEIFKNKWEIPEEVKMGEGFNYQNILNTEFNISKHFIPVL